MARRQDYARWLLGGIRLINGALALFAPKIIIGRFGEANDVPVARYALRMFGVRTILIALDLFTSGPHQKRAIRFAPIIHASDTVAALLVARSGKVAPKTAVLIVAISAVNTLLTLLMQGGEDEDAEPPAEPLPA